MPTPIALFDSVRCLIVGFAKDMHLATCDQFRGFGSRQARSVSSRGALVLSPTKLREQTGFTLSFWCWLFVLVRCRWDMSHPTPSVVRGFRFQALSGGSHFLFLHGWFDCYQLIVSAGGIYDFDGLFHAGCRNLPERFDGGGPWRKLILGAGRPSSTWE